VRGGSGGAPQWARQSETRRCRSDDWVDAQAATVQAASIAKVFHHMGQSYHFRFLRSFSPRWRRK
jgi:hypothetical protein